MKSINYVMVFIVLLSLLLYGCTSQQLPEEPPEISIAIGDIEIEYVVGKNKWDNKIFDREDTFQTILKNGSGIEIPYIEAGEIATINFMNYSPSSIKIYDILIDEGGRPIYTDREAISIPVKIIDAKCSFEINKHMASYLSSVYIEGQTYLRGYRIIASWGENECEYGFIINTGDKQDVKTISEEERQRMELYLEVLEAAFLEENGGNEFIAVKLDTLEGLSDEAKMEVLKELSNLSPNIYDFEDVKKDITKFEMDNNGDLVQTIDGSLLWIELEEYKENKAIITGVSWFGNLGAVFPKYEATYKDGIWSLKLISMAIS